MKYVFLVLGIISMMVYRDSGDLLFLAFMTVMFNSSLRMEAEDRIKNEINKLKS